MYVGHKKIFGFMKHEWYIEEVYPKSVRFDYPSFLRLSNSMSLPDHPKMFFLIIQL